MTFAQNRTKLGMQTNPVIMKRRLKIGLMLGERRRWMANIKSTLVQRHNQMIGKHHQMLYHYLHTVYDVGSTKKTH